MAKMWNKLKRDSANRNFPETGEVNQDEQRTPHPRNEVWRTSDKAPPPMRLRGLTAENHGIHRDWKTSEMPMTRPDLAGEKASINHN